MEEPPPAYLDLEAISLSKYRSLVSEALATAGLILRVERPQEGKSPSPKLIVGDPFLPLSPANQVLSMFHAERKAHASTKAAHASTQEAYEAVLKCNETLRLESQTRALEARGLDGQFAILQTALSKQMAAGFAENRQNRTPTVPTASPPVTKPVSENRTYASRAQAPATATPPGPASTAQSPAPGQQLQGPRSTEQPWTLVQRRREDMLKHGLDPDNKELQEVIEKYAGRGQDRTDHGMAQRLFVSGVANTPGTVEFERTLRTVLDDNTVFAVSRIQTGPKGRAVNFKYEIFYHASRKEAVHHMLVNILRLQLEPAYDPTLPPNRERQNEVAIAEAKLHCIERYSKIYGRANGAVKQKIASIINEKGWGDVFPPFLDIAIRSDRHRANASAKKKTNGNVASESALKPAECPITPLPNPPPGYNGPGLPQVREGPNRVPYYKHLRMDVDNREEGESPPTESMDRPSVPEPAAETEPETTVMEVERPSRKRPLPSSQAPVEPAPSAPLPPGKRFMMKERWADDTMEDVLSEMTHDVRHDETRASAPPTLDGN